MGWQHPRRSYHRAKNWHAYVQPGSKAYEDATAELYRFAAFDLRGRIVRRFPWRRRTTLLEHYYREQLFQDDTIGGLPDSPAVHILATSMTTGRLSAFQKGHFTVLVEPEDPEWTRRGERFETFVGEPGRVPVAYAVRYAAGSIPVATAVAASSAFPPLFPPLKLAPEYLADKPKDIHGVGIDRFADAEPEYLTDGGVFDNLGISRIHALVPSGVKDAFTYIFASDASAYFHHKPKPRFGSIWSRATRTTDILMQRVASLEAELWEQHGRHIKERLQRKDLIELVRMTMNIRDVERSKPNEPPPARQRQQELLRSVRTDLDVFEQDLIRALVDRGHEVAVAALAKVRVDQPAAAARWSGTSSRHS